MLFPRFHSLCCVSLLAVGILGCSMQDTAYIDETDKDATVYYVANSEPAAPAATFSQVQRVSQAPYVHTATRIEWAADWPSAVAKAEAKKKPIMIDFYTDWCGWCKVLDQKTFPDSRVIAAMTDVVAVKLNGEKEGAELVKKYGVRGYPTIVFTTPDGRLLESEGGFIGPESFAQIVQQVVDGFGRLKTRS